VPVPNPAHLFEQAEQLLRVHAGAPRQTDLRRAISNAYYGVFHATLIAAADEVVGVTYRHTARYGLVYRSVSHRALRDLCIAVRKSTMPARYMPYEPRKGFGPNIRAFAAAVVELQEKRHAADYDPMVRMRASDASLALATARSAIKRFQKASRARRKSFLTLLLFTPRPGSSE
jgi:hypothetical protein